MNKNLSILGVSISNLTKREALEYLLDRIRNSGEKTFIITPNPEMLVYAQSHSAYKDKLNKADLALSDGVGLSLAGQLSGTPIKERITGVDFIEELCKVSREKPLSMGFLGGRGGVAELAVDRLRSRYPWIKVVFIAEEWGENGFRLSEKYHVVSSKYFVENKKDKAHDTSYMLHTTGIIDILFVAYGVPKQEEWIYEHLEKLPVKAAMGVGGSFDFLSGKVQRAPKIMQNLGLEWLFRLIIQPWRWRRQLALLTFLKLLLQEKFR